MSNPSMVLQRSPVSIERVEVSRRGMWRNVPALKNDGETIVVNGQWIRVASLLDEDWIEEELRNPKECIDVLKAHSREFKADILRFSQMVPETLPRYQFPREMRSLAVAEVGNFKRWWEGLPQESRKNVRRSQKRGVRVEIKEFGPEVIAGIAGVQNETPVRQGRRYPHYGKSLEQVRRDHGAFQDRSTFLCAYFEQEMVGFLKLVYRGRIASLLQLNSKVAHYDKRPSNFLMAKAAELCAERGIQYLTYGLFSYGAKGHSPLREFKERNGFREMLIPAYYVPLTAWGEICVRFKLYRDIREKIPSRIMNTALSLRARWYTQHASKAGVAQ